MALQYDKLFLDWQVTIHNQAKIMDNETRSIYQADMDEIKGEMEKLWKVQKAMLKKQPVMSQ